MKNVIIVFLSLTCLAAHAQYNQSRSKSTTTLLTQHGSLKPAKETKPLMRIPAQSSGTLISQNTTFSLNTTNSVGPSTTQQGYWSGSQMTTTGMNGKFQSVQSFDMNGNLRETKATYQITNRKKRN